MMISTTILYNSNWQNVNEDFRYMKSRISGIHHTYNTNMNTSGVPNTKDELSGLPDNKILVMTYVLTTKDAKNGCKIFFWSFDCN